MTFKPGLFMGYISESIKR